MEFQGQEYIQKICQTQVGHYLYECLVATIEHTISCYCDDLRLYFDSLPFVVKWGCFVACNGNRKRQKLLAAIPLCIKMSLDKCIFLVWTAGQMKAFQLYVVRLISRCDIVWSLKHVQIQFGSDIYSTRCVLNGKLERKFFLKHGFLSTEKSIIQNRVQCSFFGFFFSFFFLMDQAMQIVN